MATARRAVQVALPLLLPAGLAGLLPALLVVVCLLVVIFVGLVASVLVDSCQCRLGVLRDGQLLKAGHQLGPSHGVGLDLNHRAVVCVGVCFLNALDGEPHVCLFGHLEVRVFQALAQVIDTELKCLHLVEGLPLDCGEFLCHAD